MLNKFNQEFNISKDTPLKMVELENAIMKKFGDIQYHYYKAFSYTSDYNYQKVDVPEHYSCGCKFEWESNTIYTDYSHEKDYNTREKALMGLCLGNKESFTDIVKEVYGGCDESNY